MKIRKILPILVVSLFLASCGLSNNDDLPDLIPNNPSDSHNNSSSIEVPDINSSVVEEDVNVGKVIELMGCKYQVVNDKEVALVDILSSNNTLDLTQEVTYKGKHYNVASINLNQSEVKEIGIETLKLPTTIKYIGTSGLWNACLDVYKVYYEGSISDWAGININCGESGFLARVSQFFVKDNNQYRDIKTFNEIRIPDGVTEIYNCSYQLGSFVKSYDDFGYLNSFYIPKSVKKIGNEIFYWQLLNVDLYYDGTLEDWMKIEKIGFNAFNKIFVKNAMNEYYEPTRVVVSDSFDIKPNQFANFKKLKEVVLPQSLAKIGNYAFHSCSELDSIQLPRGLKEIGMGAFASTNLDHIDFPESLVEIDSFAFQGSSLTRVDLPKNLDEIRPNTFEDCTNLRTVSIPDSVKKIGSYAFALTDIDEVTIPSSVRIIESHAFSDCRSLHKLFIPSTTDQVAIDVVTMINFEGQEEPKSVTNIYIDGNINSNWSKYAFRSAKNVFTNYKEVK